jgi:hypothetical protein
MLLALVIVPLFSPGIVHAATQTTATLSNSASDNTGTKHDRDMRQRQARLDHLQHNFDRHSAQCMHGQEDACEKARIEYGEMQDLRPTISAPVR